MSNSIKQRTLSWLTKNTDSSFVLNTRIHPLPSLQQRSVYIKREDELSSGVSGSKYRKFASLIPFLRKRAIDEIGLIGGPSSNNLVGALQLLKEADIDFWLFVREPGDTTEQGNALFMKLLAPEERIHIVPRNEWPEVDRIAGAFLDDRAAAGRETFLLPEGALCLESLCGAATLAADILKNESDFGSRFDEIFIDSGTGMSAIGLAIGLSLLDKDPGKRRLNITLIAGSESEFERNLYRFRDDLSRILDLDLPDSPRLKFLYPPFSKSYGSTGKTLFAATREIARKEGILMDPVYSVKHYLAMKAEIESRTRSPASLFIYNGSALGLTGFQTQLREAIL